MTSTENNFNRMSLNFCIVDGWLNNQYRHAVVVFCLSFIYLNRLANSHMATSCFC